MTQAPESPDRTDIVVRHQDEVRVYVNDHDDVVFWRRDPDSTDGEVWIVIPRNCVQAVIDRLRALIAESV